MKVRVTLITENDKPVSMFGENPESDKAFVESVEIIGEENNL